MKTYFMTMGNTLLNFMVQHPVSTLMGLLLLWGLLMFLIGRFLRNSSRTVHAGSGVTYKLCKARKFKHKSQGEKIC